MECAIPVTSHSSGTTRYFDLARAVPGAILTPPSLSDDVEIWTAGEAREIAWLYYKGNLPQSVSSNGRSNSHEELDTAFRIDLLRTGESLLREVMKPMTVEPFLSSTITKQSTHTINKPIYSIKHTDLANSSCTPNAYSTLSYRWTVPADLDTEPTYHLQLSTNTSDVVHFSGAFRLDSSRRSGHGCHSGRNNWREYRMRGMKGMRIEGDGHWLLFGVWAMGVLILGHFLTKSRPRRSNYETVEEESAQDEKEDVVWVVDLKEEIV